ncbi:MAG: hypothetical protein NVSMB39_7580 [Candidatus Saccharimonadales bacterium]
MSDGSLANLRFAELQDKARLAVLKHDDEYSSDVLLQAVKAAQAVMRPKLTAEQNLAVADAAAKKILAVSPKK